MAKWRGVAFSIIANFVTNADPDPESVLKICPKIPDITDIRKIRRHLPELGATLAPVMDLIGSPAADRVRAAIEQGLVSKEDFTGVFTKTIKRQVAVAKAKPGGAAADNGSRETG